MPYPAIYIRTAKLTERSVIAKQKRKLLEYAAQQGDTILRQYIYMDNGESGLNHDRPKLQRLLRAIEHGEISKVYVYDHARLSRDVLYLHKLLELFKQKNVTLVAVGSFAMV